MIEIIEITKKLNNFLEELNAIDSSANSKMDDSTGNQKFGRWKERLIVYIKDNISNRESKKCESLSYPIVMETKPLQNFNRKIKAYRSYLNVLIEELKTNPESIIEYMNKSSKVIEKEKIKTPKDKIKVFISYSTIDKEIAHQVSRKLEGWGLDVFLAHEDIEVSEQWKEIILKNLYSCDVFIPIITENFKNSDWTSQEVGIAFAGEKDIFIVPLKKGNFIPFGFIFPIQAKDINEDKFELSIIKKLNINIQKV
ncbi:MAG: toll/interleukin-1 receptor domain-containing protein [Actinobacteria bacterium]|nr:toll/interleukin-1 receptor domain-containing protein [Actinomycetota bacterium]